MKKPLILASGSVIRAALLRNAAVSCHTVSPRIDEDSVKSALLAEQASPRDIADTLAELKARKISDKHPGALVLGCDQVLDHAGTLLSKPTSRDDAAGQLDRLRGQRHQLLSAAVICEDGRPVWRHVGVVRLTMRAFSDAYLTGYLDRNWPGIADSVGGYKLEEEGVRLFSRIEGDYFTVLGLPLLELLAYLTLRGELES
jgi:septum formation protein